MIYAYVPRGGINDMRMQLQLHGHGIARARPPSRPAYTRISRFARRGVPARQGCWRRRQRREAERGARNRQADLQLKGMKRWGKAINPDQVYSVNGFKPVNYSESPHLPLRESKPTMLREVDSCECGLQDRKVVAVGGDF